MKTKILIGAVVIFAGLSVFLYIAIRSAESNYLYREAVVPHIDLGGSIVFFDVDTYGGKLLTSSNKGDIAIGKITGFVKFVDIKQQPKKTWQYYSIVATDKYDNELNQKFILEDTLKFPYLPPKEFDTKDLQVVGNTQTTLMLADEAGSTYTINKRTHEVTVDDASSGMVELIIDNDKYKDFMLEFLSE